MGGGSNTGNRQDNRQRGNAAQLLEKYKGLARDAQMQGDRVQTETYLQYADHYFRVLNESRARYEEQRRQRGDDYGEDEGDQDGDGGREGAYRDGGDDIEPREEVQRDSYQRDTYQREDRAAREDRPIRDDRPVREDRAVREDRPVREARPAREDRVESAERNGEYRGRRPRTPRVEADEDVGSERIALDVLPPAIAVANEGGDEPARATRTRRPRRPRGEDKDIAPAA